MIKIYELIDPNTDETKYIGQTSKDLSERLRGHLYETKSDKKNNKRCNWIKSLQVNNLLPIINLIDMVDDGEWEFWEKWYIDLYKCWGINLKNTTGGGIGCYSPTLEVRKKVGNKKGAKIHTTQHKLNLSKKMLGINNSFYGKTHSKQVLEKIRQANYGNKNHRVKVKRIDSDGKEILFDSVKLAGESVDTSHSNITRTCRRKNNTFANYKWEYA